MGISNIKNTIMIVAVKYNFVVAFKNLSVLIFSFFPPILTVADTAGNISHRADVRAGCGRSPHIHFSNQTVSLGARQDPFLHSRVSPEIQLPEMGPLKSWASAAPLELPPAAGRRGVHGLSDSEASEEESQQM